MKHDTAFLMVWQYSEIADEKVNQRKKS